MHFYPSYVSGDHKGVSIFDRLSRGYSASLERQERYPPRASFIRVCPVIIKHWKLGMKESRCCDLLNESAL